MALLEDLEVGRPGGELEVVPPAARRPVELDVLDLIQERWDSPGVLRVAL